MLNWIKNLYYFSGLSVIAQWFTSIVFLMPFFYLIKKLKVSYEAEPLDPDKNYIFVSNHRSLKDPPLLGLATMRPVSFIAKKELFRNPFLATFMYLTSTISVDREAAESQTFKAAKKALSSTGLGIPWNLGIFIEGTRSTDEGKLGKPNKGPIFIARLTKAAIVPIGISYKASGEIEVKIGAAYEIDYKADLEDQAWECLEKISQLCDYGMPVRL